MCRHSFHGSAVLSFHCTEMMRVAGVSVESCCEVSVMSVIVEGSVASSYVGCLIMQAVLCHQK